MFKSKSVKPKLKMIAAVDLNFGLGYNNKLLTHNKEDLQHFKRVTMGHTLIMGRKTFYSIPSQLEGRKFIVCTRSIEYPKWLNDDAILVNGIPLGDGKIVGTWSDINFIAGGGEIYKKYIELDIIDEIILTVLDFEADNVDTYFPTIPDHYIITDTKPIDGGTIYTFQRTNKTINRLKKFFSKFRP